MGHPYGRWARFIRGCAEGACGLALHFHDPGRPGEDEAGSGGGAGSGLAPGLQLVTGREPLSSALGTTWPGICGNGGCPTSACPHGVLILAQGGQTLSALVLRTGSSFPTSCGRPEPPVVQGGMGP